MATLGLDQVGDEDAHDQGRLQPLAQPDQVVRQHDGCTLHPNSGKPYLESRPSAPGPAPRRAGRRTSRRRPRPSARQAAATSSSSPAVADPSVHQLARQRGAREPVGPQAAPPRRGPPASRSTTSRSSAIDVGARRRRAPTRASIRPGVRLASVGAGGVVVQLAATGRGPPTRGATRSGRSRCRARRRPRPGRVTRSISRSAPTGSATCWQDLVGVHDVELAPLGQVEVVHVTDDDGSRWRPLRAQLGAGEVGGLVVDLEGHHLAHQAGQVGGDRARARPDVEETLPGVQVGQEVRRRVGGRAPAVRAQHGLGMPVGVGVHGHSEAVRSARPAVSGRRCPRRSRSRATSPRPSACAARGRSARSGGSRPSCGTR